MDWKAGLQSVRDAGQKAVDAKTEVVIEQHWPQIQQVFRQKVGPAALSAAQDDQKMTITFKLVYAVLPFPVHLAVKEDDFVKFCFAHRDRLLPAAQSGAGAA